MNPTPREHYSISRGAKVVGSGIIILAKEKPLIFIWINFFGGWFLGGAALMMYRGATSILPLVCLLTPIITLPWLTLVASKYGFSRLLGLPRAIPWLVAMTIAIIEFINGSYVNQPEGYKIFLVGFIIINGVATLWDFFDIYQWINGDRGEHPDTGFFN
ncbi:MAG: hypothetical protein E2O68_08035 [Deltaproteobacteria bacterium]|nr:MAG: hypothetical protein E2O68_08035 [Deltaproteobacteria bacterium]